MMDEIERKMLTKLFQIRQILEVTPGPLCLPGQQVQDGRSINKQRPGHVIGIFSVEETDPTWLKAVLSSSVFNETVKMTKYTISKDTKLKDSVSESTFCIFLTDLFTWNITSSLEKDQELGKLGGKPLIVVIDDAEDSGDAKAKLLKNPSKIHVKDLFLFSKLEKKCALMKYTNNDHRTDFMPSAKDPLLHIPAAPNQGIHVKPAHVTHMIDPLLPIPVMPDHYRQVNMVHSPHMMGTLAPFTYTPNQNRYVNDAHAAHTMGKATLAPFPVLIQQNMNFSHAPQTTDPLVPIQPMSNQGRHVNTADARKMMGFALVPATSNQDRNVNIAHAAHMMGVDTLAPFPAPPNQNMNSNHSAHTMEPRVLIPAMPNQDGHVHNTTHAAYMRDPLVPVPDMQSQDRHVSTQHKTHMMGVNTLAMFPAIQNLNKPVSSYHKAHTIGVEPPVFGPTSTNKEGHGYNSHPAQIMGEELLVEISPTSSLERFNNYSSPTQIVDPPVSASSTPNQHKPTCTPDSKDMMEKSYNYEPKTNISSKQAGIKHSIGIFSRSSDEDYSWLVELLTSENFRNGIQEVKLCYISNNGFQRFIEVLSQCTFGILYHTKNRGRVNITNVCDSLYDEELDYLEKMLGKDNVIVVIDDLENCSDQEKTRILKNQPSIGELASNLLLISRAKKADKMQLVEELKSVPQLYHP